nr:MAG TPA: hypothetical protein [Caudoviricetes sp.]
MLHSRTSATLEIFLIVGLTEFHLYTLPIAIPAFFSRELIDIPFSDALFETLSKIFSAVITTPFIAIGSENITKIY